MKRVLFFTSIFFICFIFTDKDLAAAESFSDKQENINPKDSIVLINKKSGKEKIILTGNQIKLWLAENDSIVTGNFIGIKNDSLQIRIDGADIQVSTDKIKAIRSVTKSTKRILGTIFLAIGLSAVGFAVMLIIAGMASGYISYVAIYTLLIALPGAGLSLIGNALLGKKFRLDKNWTIKKTE